MKQKLVFASITITLIVAVIVGMILFDKSNTKASNTKIVVFHYQRPDDTYDDWNVWLWEFNGQEIGASNFTGIDSYGAYAVAECNANVEKLGFRVRYSTTENAWAEADVGKDRFLQISTMDRSTIHVYLKSGEEEFDANSADQQIITRAELYGRKKIQFELADLKRSSSELMFMLRDQNGKQVDIKQVELEEEGKKGYIITQDNIDLQNTYTLYNGVGNIINVYMMDYYDTQEFNKNCIYEEDDLGVTITNNHTKFRVWAPTAESLSLNLYKTGSEEKNDKIKSYTMTKDKGGTWLVEFDQDLTGYYYTYTVKYDKQFHTYYKQKYKIEVDSSNGYEAGDPYARSGGVNGYKSMVIDPRKASPDNWNNDTNKTVEKITDASIYEISVRDTSTYKDDGIKNTGKYISFLERGTKTSSGKSTGMDHIVNMGINMVQIMPIYDYASVDEKKSLTNDKYNWGYDPANFNMPEGLYSTNPADGRTRVVELKQMIQEFHKENIGVIMDVVYNHTYFDYPFGFSVLVPGYFHRPNSNTSGCGNDTATERTMVTKYIVDSIKYWAEEYHIDGFRFDLMGLIDLDTMNKVRKELDDINKNIIMYGEGWYMDSTNRVKDVYLCNQNNCRFTGKLGFFNDAIRTGIRGNNDSNSLGFVQGNNQCAKTIAYSAKAYAIWSKNEPYQTINYVSCHDNYTLWDKLVVSGKKTSEKDLIKQNKLAASIVYTSQGAPLMLQGEEFLRTKENAKGEKLENTYNSPDSINQLDYSRMDKYYDVVEYYKGLIELRKHHAAFRMGTKAEVDENFHWLEGREIYDEGVVAFQLDKVKGEVADSIVVIYNNNKTGKRVNIPSGEWEICVNAEKAGVESLGKAWNSLEVAPMSCCVLVKGSTKNPSVQ